MNNNNFLPFKVLGASPGSLHNLSRVQEDPVGPDSAGVESMIIPGKGLGSVYKA